MGKIAKLMLTETRLRGRQMHRTHISWIRWIRNPECTRREWRSATWLLNDSYYANDAVTRPCFNWLNTIPAIPQMRLRFIICVAVSPNVNYRERKAHLREPIYFPSLSAVNVSYILRYRFVLEEKKFSLKCPILRENLLRLVVKCLGLLFSSSSRVTFVWCMAKFLMSLCYRGVELCQLNKMKRFYVRILLNNLFIVALLKNSLSFTMTVFISLAHKFVACRAELE